MMSDGHNGDDQEAYWNCTHYSMKIKVKNFYEKIILKKFFKKIATKVKMNLF